MLGDNLLSNTFFFFTWWTHLQKLFLDVYRLFKQCNTSELIYSSFLRWVFTHPPLFNCGISLKQWMTDESWTNYYLETMQGSEMFVSCSLRIVCMLNITGEDASASIGNSSAFLVFFLYLLSLLVGYALTNKRKKQNILAQILPWAHRSLSTRQQKFCIISFD